MEAAFYLISNAIVVYGALSAIVLVGNYVESGLRDYLYHLKWMAKHGRK
jgi:hypothetical protein